jgi:hypothetical protein
MIRMLAIAAAALALSGCDEVSYSVTAPGVEKSARFIGVTLPDGTTKMVPAVAMKKQQTFDEMRKALKERCDRLTGIDHLKDLPFGEEVFVFKATCDSGEFQVTAIGEDVYVKRWTGRLQDAS